MAPKAKAQKMSLGDFLGDQTLGSWADEMEDMPLTYRSGFSGERRAVSSAAGFGDRSYDRGDRGYQREALPLPTKPPFTAHLGNLPFDATQEHIEEFFGDCEVSSVRIVEDKIERRPKGFGYVEFGSLDGLKKALDLNMSQFRGRNIKISVADPPKDRPEARELSDWTRKGPLPDLPGNNTRRASDRGGMREGQEMERGGSRRGAPAFDGDGKVRDFNNWERKGPLSSIPGAEPVRGNGRVRPQEGARERKNSPSWGGDRSQDGSRPPRGEFRERERPPPVERQPTAADLDTEWRARMRPDGPVKTQTPTPEASTPSSPRQATVPTVRPKLNLQKRTVSEAEPASAVTPSDSKASPFGAARPIDTTAREKQVEEKRQLALRQKREVEEKARDEKRAKEAEAKAAAEQQSAQDQNGSADKDTKGNGTDAPNPTRSYTILSRVADEENVEEEEKTEEAPKEAPKESKPNGVASEAKPTKNRGPPREHREPPRGPKHPGGSWRQRKPSASSSPATAGGNNPEEDGWSTVGPTKGRGQRSRGGRGGGS